MYKWPLNITSLSIEDKQKISEFILTSNRWTQGHQVQLFEKKFADYIGCKYALFVSNGSVANTILAQYTKDFHQNTVKNKVVLPATTWQTSCSPWIREGFEPVFIDVSLEDFCIDQKQLEIYVKKNAKSIACIFPTSLIGFSPNIDFFQYIQNTYQVNVMFDNCENTFGQFNNRHISSYFTSTTSTYFGHQIQSVEGGFIFTNDIKEFEYFLMMRNHGMSRSLKPYDLDNTTYLNKDVDEAFDFYCLGSNYRNTDINAFIGQIDLEKINYHTHNRTKIYNLYQELLDKKQFYLPPARANTIDIPFCLPVISYDKARYNKAIKVCKAMKIEYRPIISGFLGYQTCYRKYFNKLDHNNFQNSIFLHNNGFYIGLYSGLKPENIVSLTNELNNM